MNKKQYIYYLFIAIFLSSTCIKPDISPQETWLTIFIHGIMSIKPHLSMANFLRFMTDNVENTVYSYTVDLMRNDPHFYKNQAMQGPGLKHIDLNNNQKGNASGALAMLFDTIAQESTGIKAINNYYYTYGWSGLLSPSRRYKDAKDLYASLTHEVEQLSKQHVAPKIRLIGYSHGGNICLNLALVQRREQPTTPLDIDELILIGMPVQKETDYLINHKMYKKIYHFYSRGDRIQKIDFFSFNRFFSRRIFKERKGFRLPHKLMQVQLKTTRNAKNIKKRKQARNNLNPRMNFKNSTVVSGKSPFLRNVAPGHSELWFFGWTPLHYRKTYPLRPLPTVAMIPYITHHLSQLEHKPPAATPIVVDMRPQQGITIIKHQDRSKHFKVVNFLPKKKFNELKQKAQRYAPDNYTPQAYMERIKVAYEQAKLLYRQQRKKRLPRKHMAFAHN